MRVVYNSQVADIALEHSPLVTESAEDTISRLEQEAVIAYQEQYKQPIVQNVVRFLHYKHSYIAAHID